MLHADFFQQHAPFLKLLSKELHQLMDLGQQLQVLVDLKMTATDQLQHRGHCFPIFKSLNLEPLMAALKMYLNY